MKLNKINPKFINKSNPRIGLITLGSDFSSPSHVFKQILFY